MGRALFSAVCGTVCCPPLVRRLPDGRPQQGRLDKRCPSRGQLLSGVGLSEIPGRGRVEWIVRRGVHEGRRYVLNGGLKVGCQCRQSASEFLDSAVDVPPHGVKVLSLRSGWSETPVAPSSASGGKNLVR